MTHERLQYAEGRGMTLTDALLLIAEITAGLYLFHRLLDETLGAWVQWRDDQGEQ